MTGFVNVAFVGNPNCGKTTLFNAYTGANLKVANWPGVTVEKKEGIIKHMGNMYKLIDLPGVYSLTSYTLEEKLARQFILTGEVDIIVNIVDATCLERSLYLTLQLAELGKPFVIALNMMDIAQKRGIEINIHKLQETLKVPVIPICASKKQGLDALARFVYQPAFLHRKSFAPLGTNAFGKHAPSRERVMVYSRAVEDKIDILSSLLKNKYGGTESYRWKAIKFLESDREIIKRYPLNHSVSLANVEPDIINQRYKFIEKIIATAVTGHNSKSLITDRADNILMSSIFGIPIFLGIMAAIFFLTFTVGDWFKGYFENGLSSLSAVIYRFLIYIKAGDVFTSLTVDGVLAGVGAILTFLPNIFILFLSLGFLEDSGYMARVAYLMDSIMGRLGLSGKAFIPMLLGFGCTVPAIMATRTLENKKDMLKTILITPFMSCSARLPIYVLLSKVFFEENAMIVSYSMYIIGIIVAVTIALIINVIDKKGSDSTLLIELPEYKAPNFKTMLIYAFEKAKDYLAKAGTVILFATVIMWGLLNFGPGGTITYIEESFGAYIGKLLIPIMKPAGLGYWQIIVALIAGIAAKEVVVSSMAVLYGVGSALSDSGISKLVFILSEQGFSGANAYSMMLFCLLYVPCIAAIAAIKKETNSLKWTAVALSIQFLTAWTVSAIFYTAAVYIF